MLRQCLPNNYDEERRLLHVAITRARHHVIFAGGAEPNAFFEGLPVDIEHMAPDVAPGEHGETTQAQLPFTVSPPDGPVGLTPHDLMNDSVYETEASGVSTGDEQGVGFGREVHNFAEQYALGENVTPSIDHDRRIKDFIDTLDGELFVKEPAMLPISICDQWGDDIGHRRPRPRHSR